MGLESSCIPIMATSNSTSRSCAVLLFLALIFLLAQLAPTSKSLGRVEINNLTSTPISFVWVGVCSVETDSCRRAPGAGPLDVPPGDLGILNFWTTEASYLSLWVVFLDGHVVMDEVGYLPTNNHVRISLAADTDGLLVQRVDLEPSGMLLKPCLTGPRGSAWLWQDCGPGRRQSVWER